MSGARRTLIPCRCACSTTSRTVPLVEVRLGEDHLVGSRVLEHARELFPASEAAEPWNPVLGDDADELVGEPAPRGRERVPRSTRLLPSPTSTTRRRTPRPASPRARPTRRRRGASRSSSADATTAVGMSPEVVKS